MSFNFQTATPVDPPSNAVIMGGVQADGSPAVYALSNLKTLNALDYIPVANRAAIRSYTGADVTTYLQGAIDALDTAGGGVLFVPPGRYKHAGLSLNGKKSVIITGLAGTDMDLANRGAILEFTGAAGTMRGIDMRSSEGCELDHLSIVYSSATFDGYAVDFALPATSFITGNRGRVRHCSFYQTGSTSRTCRAHLNLYRAVEVEASDNLFAGAQVGVTGAPHATVTISNASPGVVTWANHGLLATEQVTFETTGALPTGLTQNTIYFVKTVLDANTFTVSATSGGAVINTSSAGSGTHIGSTVCHVESIAAHLSRNQYAVLAIAGVTNPGINWKLNGEVFEPDTGFIPLGVRSYGGCISINCDFDHCTFADGYATGIYIKLRSTRNTNINKCSFGSDGIADVTGIQIDGLTIAGSFSNNYFAFTKVGINYVSTITGHTARGNDMTSVWGTKITNLFFAGKDSDFSCNYPEQLLTVTALPASSTMRVYDNGSGQWSHMPSEAAGSGLKSLLVSASQMVPRTTAGCAALATFEGATNKIMRRTLDFDASTQEYAQFEIRLPKGFNKVQPLKFSVAVSHAFASPNVTSVWSLQAVAIPAGFSTDEAFSTAVNVSVGGALTDAIYYSARSADITLPLVPDDESILYCQISRVAANGSDTLPIDARLHAVTVYYQTNASNDS